MSITKRTVGFVRRGHGSESDFHATRADQSVLHADMGAREFGRDYVTPGLGKVPQTRPKKFDDTKLVQVMQAWNKNIQGD